MTYDEFDKVRRILHQSFIDAEANIFKRLDKLGNFRFDEWFSKKSYIDIYFFMSGLIFDFTVEHKIYIFSIFVN